MTRLMARNSPETVETKSPTLRFLDLSLTCDGEDIRPRKETPVSSYHDRPTTTTKRLLKTSRHEPLLQLQQLRPRPWIQGYPPLRLHFGVFFESWVLLRGAGITRSSREYNTGSELDNVSARHYPRNCSSRGTSRVDGGRTTWLIA